MNRTHVVCESLSEEPGIQTMWCGEQCLILPYSGEIVPEDFDFYMEATAYKSDCIECLKGRLSKTIPLLIHRTVPQEA